MVSALRQPLDKLLMCCPPPLASQYRIINILCTPGRYPWPWPKPLVPTRHIPPLLPLGSRAPIPPPFLPTPLPFFLAPSRFSPRPPAQPTPVSPHHLPGARVRAPAANTSSVGGAAGWLCAGALSGGRRGGAAGGLRARARARLLCWARLGTGGFSLARSGRLGLDGRGEALQQHHVPALSQPLEPGVLCLHGGSGHPGGVGCLLRLRGEQVQHELHV